MYPASSNSTAAPTWRGLLFGMRQALAVFALCSCSRPVQDEEPFLLLSSDESTAGSFSVELNAYRVARGRAVLCDFLIREDDEVLYSTSVLALFALDATVASEARTEIRLAQDPESAQMHRVGVGSASVAYAAQRSAGSASARGGAAHPPPITLREVRPIQFRAPAGSPAEWPYLGEPSLSFVGEEVVAPSGAVFLSIVGADGPTRPVPLEAPGDPGAILGNRERFVGRLLESTPELGRLLVETERPSVVR